MYEKFCESVTEHAMKKTNFKKKKMKLLTNEQQNSYQNPKICYICKGKFDDKHIADKKYIKVRDHVNIQENIEVLRIVYVI